MHLTPNLKTTLCKTAVSAGTTDVTDASVIDMQNWEGVRFIFALGAIVSGAATSVAVAGKDTNSPTPGTDDLEGTKITVVDTADDTLVIVDVYQPRHRYIRPFVKRATQNAAVNAIFAEQYGPRKMPITQDTSVTATNLKVAPAVGTA